jgi:hypothetical protein
MPNSRYLPDKLADGQRQFARPVFGEQGIAVGDLHEAPVGEQLGESPTVRRSHGSHSTAWTMIPSAFGLR